MAKIGNWGGHIFEVKRRLARGFTGLTLKGGSDYETKTNGKQQFAARKAGKPLEIGMTVVLDSRLGADAQADATKLVEQARSGHKSYFYLDGKKLTPCQLMLTSASAEEIVLTSGGKWVSANVKLTLIQSSKNDGTAGTTPNTGGKSKKVSVKKPAKPSGGIGSLVSKAATPSKTPGNFLSNIKNAMNTKSAQATINRVIANAKKFAVVSKQGGGKGGVNAALMK